MNKISIMGRLTKDVELRTAQAGNEFGVFTVAVDNYKGKDKEKTVDYFDCIAGGKAGVFINQYFHKGDGIVVHGEMHRSEYQDKDGNKRISWKLSVKEVEFPLGKGKGGTESVTTAPSYVEMPNDGELPF